MVRQAHHERFNFKTVHREHVEGRIYFHITTPILSELYRNQPLVPRHKRVVVDGPLVYSAFKAFHLFESKVS